jgi:D-alanyl-D-alanine carboxypeptidase
LPCRRDFGSNGIRANHSFNGGKREMKKYLYSLAFVAALGGILALAQNTPQHRDPSDAPQQQPPTSIASQADVQKDITSALQKDPSLAGANISAQVSSQGVELSGTAPSQDAKDAAEQIAKAHSGGLPVTNHIKVAGAPK